jgi:hypothetical protein
MFFFEKEKAPPNGARFHFFTKANINTKPKIISYKPRACRRPPSQINQNIQKNNQVQLATKQLAPKCLCDPITITSNSNTSPTNLHPLLGTWRIASYQTVGSQQESLGGLGQKNPQQVP